MQNDWINVIGLMSGTSLDGLDIAYCSFKEVGGKWQWEILQASTIPYPDNISDKLAQSLSLSSEELFRLDIFLGNWIGEQTSEFIQKKNLQPHLISSHGHTIFHQPINQSTVQIGSGNAIYLKTGVPVVNNFRQLDVLKGGQGAPLVPIGDLYLFDDYDCCINLGGIANISIKLENGIYAFDICACNMVLNSLALLKGLPYDEEGKVAQKGRCHQALLEELSDLSYYKKTFPKSLGKEDVEKDVLSILDNYDISVESKLATFTQHIAQEIAQCINKHSVKKVLISGGGVHNSFLIDSIQNRVNEKVIINKPSDLIINYKEALVFAFLGVLRLKNKTNILSSVTGAESDSVAGDLIGIESI